MLKIWNKLTLKIDRTQQNYDLNPECKKNYFNTSYVTLRTKLE